MSLLRALLKKFVSFNLRGSRKVVTAVAAAAVVVSPLIGVASPATAVVDCNALFAGGAGTAVDPWKVSTAAHFNSIRDCGSTGGKYFEQLNDISLAAYPVWSPILQFGAVYNGRNFKITDLTISYGTDYAALIRFTTMTAQITGVNIVVNSVYGAGTAGAAGLVAENNGGISASSISGGAVTSTAAYVGALVAINNVTGTINNSWASNNVSTTSHSAGGLVGINQGGVITNSYARGNISASGRAGGLVGWNRSFTADPSITNSYSTGSVSASSEAGGLLGYSDIAGGSTGVTAPFSGKSFWDTVTSGRSIFGTNYPVVSLPMLVGKTTTEMKSYATFGPSGGNWKITSGWDVYDGTNKIWGICPGVNAGYPYLLWQDPTGTGCGFPGPPSTATATVGDTSATVSWVAPAIIGSSSITGYTVTSSVGSKTCSATASERSCTVTGLTTGQAYTFTVTATNTSGTGSASNAVTVTPMGLPVEVIDAAPIATRGAGSATLTWINKVSPNVTGYLVTASPGGASCTALTSTLSPPSCVVGGLTNGMAYTFTVKTTNAAGTSLTASAASSPVTPRTLPGSPVIASVSPSGSGQVTLYWSAPVDNGGDEITEYVVTSNPGSFTCTTSTLSCTVNGLTNGNPYTFSVVAKNGEGYGSPSSASASATPRTTPNAPTSVTGTSHNSSASVSWIAPASDGGATITEYQVRAYDSSDISRGICTVVMPSPLSCDVTGLTNGVSYRFGVFAYNSEGYGQRSSLSSAVIPLSKPGIPTSVLVLAGDESALVTWTPPTDDGGATLTSFTAISSPGGHTCTATSPSTICYVPGLTNGVAYTFTVTARSAAFATVGASDPSLASAVVTPRTVPSAPVISTVTPGDDEFVVSFTPPSSDGGNAITGYEYSRDNGATWHAMASTGTSSPQRIAGLTTSTTYSIQLRAVNGAGESVASNAVSAIFVSAPGAPTGLTGVAGNNGVALTWIPPVTTGGLSLVSYTATASPGGASCTVLVPATTCDVVGLTNGVNYTFTVTATNNVGTSVASTQSVGLMPLPPGQSDTTFEIVIAVTVGDPVAGGTAEFTSSGLEPGAPWSLIVRSSPRLLTSGNAGAAGTILGNAVIPAGLEAGWHSLTLSGRDYLGREASSTKWFLINSSGELVSSSSSDPTVSPTLASTGRDVPGMMQVAALMMLLGAVILSLKGIRRRFS